MNLFRNGLPTDMDVRRLRETWPDSTLTNGREIEYESVAKLLDIDKKSNRFITITTRWRKKLEEESGIILKPVFGQGKWKVADDSDKADLSVTKGRMAQRAAKRSVQIAGRVIRANLNEDQRRRFDFSQRFCAAVIGLATVKQQAELPTI